MAGRRRPIALSLSRPSCPSRPSSHACPRSRPPFDSPARSDRARRRACLAAVSGGSDSVALVHLLRELDAAGELRLAGLAHFNHQLRATAADDERFAAAVAAALGVADVRRTRRRRGARAPGTRSIEDAARTARHASSNARACTSGADVVALGHTRDDQAETVLLRLCAAPGPARPRRHVSAQRPHHPSAARRPPSGLARVARRPPHPFVEDETNADVAIPRNRVRAELLPLLAARFNPSIV